MFRYDRPQAGRYRQFWQFDVEAIGDPGSGDRCRDRRARAALLRRRRGDGRRGPRQLDRRSGLPAGLPRDPRGVLPRASRRPPAARARPARAERAPPPRLEGPGDGGAERARRPGSRTTCAPPARPTSPGCRPTWQPSASPAASSRGSSGASTTTRGPPSSTTSRAGRDSSRRIGGGGRYDGLVELLGGRPTPGIGFGLGLDRVALVLDEQAGTAADAGDLEAPDAVVVSADPDDTIGRLRVATELRAAGLRARADLGRRKLGRQLEAAARDGAHFAVILGRRARRGPGRGPRPEGRDAATRGRQGPRPRADPVGQAAPARRRRGLSSNPACTRPAAAPDTIRPP